MNKSHEFADPVSRGGAAAGFRALFRDAAPYITAHRGQLFVIYMEGRALADPNFDQLVQDIVLLHSLGVRILLVPGARPQIDARARARGWPVAGGEPLRVTDAALLQVVREGVDEVAATLKARLSRSTMVPVGGLPGSAPRLRIAEGNFLLARPLGVIDGVDYQFTGRVRRLDEAAIRSRLEGGALVLISPLGHSPSGELFNLSAPEVAADCALALGAGKLIHLGDRALTDAEGNRVSQLEPTRLRQLATTGGSRNAALLELARAVENGTPRAHVLGFRHEGELLTELFTEAGAGTLVRPEYEERLRPAREQDLTEILALLAPLEIEGTVAPRTAEQIRADLEHFSVAERREKVVGCAALYPFGERAELAAFVVHPEHRKSGLGERLLAYVEARARDAVITELFVLTTQSADYFRERGFDRRSRESLPVERAGFYNFQRNPQVLGKWLGE